jgi:hypothetical protein
MKHIYSGFNLIRVMALLALAVGCASMQPQTQTKENLLIAAGFQAIVASTAAQQQKLQALPGGQSNLGPERRADLLRVSGRS